MTVEKKIYVRSRRTNKYHYFGFPANFNKNIGFLVGHKRNKTYKSTCGCHKKENAGYSCECHKRTSISSWNCKKLDCGQCGDVAVMKRSDTILGYMLGIQEDKPVKFLRHYSLNTIFDPALKSPFNSVPEDRLSFQKLRKKINMILFQEGVENFVLYYHHFRLDQSKDELKVSPHFHVITDTKIQSKTKAFEIRHGFNYSFHRWVSCSDPEMKKYTSCQDVKGKRITTNHEDGFMEVACNLIAYPLSHAWVFKSTKAYYYGGEINKKKVVGKTEFMQVPVCEECNTKMFAIAEYKAKYTRTRYVRKLLRGLRYKIVMMGIHYGIEDIDVGLFSMYADILDLHVCKRIEVLSLDKSDWLQYAYHIKKLAPRNLGNANLNGNDIDTIDKVLMIQPLTERLSD